MLRADVTARRVAVTLRELSAAFLPGGAHYAETGAALLAAGARFTGTPAVAAAPA